MGRGRPAAEGCRNDRAGAPPVCKQGAGASGAAAAVGKRRRERDAELQIQAPRLTVRRYEKWGTNIPGRATVGGRRQLPGARWRGRPVCARGGRPCGGSGGTNARVSVFFIHIHPRLRRGAPAGRKGGPISSASGSFSSLCWSWGRRAGRRRREAARARRGERHRPCGAARRAVRRTAKRIAQLWTTIGAAGQPFAQPWASALSERPFRPRRKPRAPVRTWPQRPG